MSEDRKVRKFLQGITASELETPEATVIATDHLIGSFDNTVNFLKWFTVDWSAASRQRGISSVPGRGRGGYGRGGRGGANRGHGNGRSYYNGRGGGGRSGRGGRSGSGKGGRSGEVTDRYYTPDEWAALKPDQQQKVRDLRNERDRARGVGALNTNCLLYTSDAADE